MKTSVLGHATFACLALSLLSLPVARAADDAAAAAVTNKIRVLLVTGGHEYETNQFRRMFAENPEITLQLAEHPQPKTWLKAEAAREWDVLVLYDFWQDITDAEKADFVARLKEGKGLVTLHHSLANYQAWPEFEHLVGGRYNLEKRVVEGKEHPQSTYQHDVDIAVKVANPQHPVVKGVSDFTIHDETYGLIEVAPQVHALLTTEEPTSGKVIGWARNLDTGRVVYLQLGHDHQAYENPNYRKLVANAIRWTARRD